MRKEKCLQEIVPIGIDVFKIQVTLYKYQYRHESFDHIAIGIGKSILVQKWLQGHI